MVLATEQPSEGATRDSRDASSTPARIEMCEIIDVDYERHEVEVWSAFSNARVDGIELGTVYCHPDGEDGLYFMPEPGASALIHFTSDGNEYVLGFFMPTSGERGSKGIRPEMNPGDIVLSTRDRNHVILRRGGVIEIGATPLCQRFYLPMGNIIHDVFEQWKGSSIVGEFSWLHDPIDPEVANNDPEKEVKVLYTWKTREFVQDEQTSIEVKAGHVDDEENPGYIQLEIKPQGGDQTFILRILKDGSLEAALKGYFKIEVEAEVEVTANRIKLSTGGFELAADSGGVLRVKASSLVQQIAGKAATKAAEIVLQGMVRLGGNGAPHSVIRGEPFMQGYLTHTHPLGPGGTGPPATAIVGVLSPKVKVV